MAKPHIEGFWTCVLADTELRIDDKSYPWICGLRFGADWVELETGLRYNDEANVKQHLALLRAAQKIEIDIGVHPGSKAFPQQMLRTFEPIKLVSERFETRPYWYVRTEAENFQNTDGKNAPAWYCIFRFEVQK